VAPNEIFRAAVLAHQEAVAALHGLEGAFAEAAEALALCIGQSKKVLLCGNGGSAADAQHLAAEFVGRFQKERGPLPALALHTDTSALTSIANDYGFEEVYARQVEAHGRPGDVLIALSTSGNSPNVLRAAERARAHSILVVGMTGSQGGELRALSDVWIGVPSDVTARIQECHILIGHALCEAAECRAPFAR
jgi:D-sedoheptulose 7-phosphate isomerase